MWKCLFDSVSGTSHLETGTPCQDSCRVIEFDSRSGPVLVLACSDGAGSASHSHEGSQLVCDTLVEIVEQEWNINSEIDRVRIVEWLVRLRERIEHRALQLEVPTRQLASTVLLAIITPTASSFAQIGDGAIALCVNGIYGPVFWPQSGEYASTTNFLTQNDFDAVLEFHRHVGRIDEVAVFTDGLERLILRFAETTVHAPFLEPLMAILRQATSSETYIEPLRQFLGSAEINERTNDDKTLILATRMQLPKNP